MLNYRKWNFFLKKGKIQKKKDRTKTKHIKVTLNWNVQQYQLDIAQVYVFLFNLLTFIYIHTYTGEGNGNPLRYSCLESSMGRRIWWATVHGVTKSQIQLWGHKESDTTEHTHAYIYIDQERKTLQWSDNDSYALMILYL